MSSKEIVLWLDERWYQALSQRLRDETLEDKLSGYLDELVSQLPERVRETVSGEIQEERQRLEREVEAGRKYSAFRVTENGVTEHLRTDRAIGLLGAAGYVRTCLRRELGPRPFREMVPGRQEITAEEFDRMALRCASGNGKVTDVYDVDFDTGEFSAVSAGRGWRTYRMGDVSAAVWHADRGGTRNWNIREERLIKKLEGKEIVSVGHLSAEHISLSEEMVEDRPRDAPGLQEETEQAHGPEMSM